MAYARNNISILATKCSLKISSSLNAVYMFNKKKLPRCFICYVQSIFQMAAVKIH